MTVTKTIKTHGISWKNKEKYGVGQTVGNRHLLLTWLVGVEPPALGYTGDGKLLVLYSSSPALSTMPGA